MPLIDDLVRKNQDYAATFPGSPPAQPGLRLAVVACMDTRLDLLGALGLEIGDAHIIRNAGGLVTADILRSLAISQHKLGTREIVILHHTECGMQGLDDAAFRAELAQTGTVPTWDVPGFEDLEAQLRASVATVRQCPWLVAREDVRGFVYDVAAGRLVEVS